MKTSLFSANLDDEQYDVTTSCTDKTKQDLRTKRKRILSEDFSNSSNHCEQEVTMNSQKDFHQRFEPIFPNFITQTKPVLGADASRANDTMVSADSGLGSLNSSLNYSGIESNMSQNVTSDSNRSCAEVVESPMKRLALMSLENHPQDCQNSNMRINTSFNPPLQFQTENSQNVTTSPVKITKIDMNMKPVKLKNHEAGDLPKRNLNFEMPSSHPMPTNFQFTRPSLLVTNYKGRKRDFKLPSPPKSLCLMVPRKPIIGARLGEKYIDFVTELGSMNLHHVISKISESLRLKDVYR